MVVPHRTAVECAPDLLCVVVVFRRYTLSSERTVEGRLWWKSLFLKALPTVHMLIGVDTLTQQQTALLFIGLVLVGDKAAVKKFIGSQAATKENPCARALSFFFFMYLMGGAAGLSQSRGGRYIIEHS